MSMKEDKTYMEKPTVATNESDEIDLKDILVKLWQQRKFILIVTAVFFLLGIFIAFTSPVSYSASCTVVPQTGNKGGGNLGGLASMMGVNLGSAMSGETLSPSVYPHIVKSAPFGKEIMATPITVKKSSTPITLYEYYTDKKYQPKSFLNGVKKYTIGLPETILSAVRSGSKTEDNSIIYADTLTGEIVTLTDDEKDVYDIINANIQFESNSKDGYIKLGYTFPEAEAVAVISQQLYNVLERYVKNFKAQKEQDNLRFVQASYNEARRDFLQKQTNLAAYQDANRGLVTATAQATERRLSSEYDIAFTIYNELAKQLEQAKLSVKQSTPVLTVIDPVVVPHEKSAPKKSMIMAVFLMLGLIFSMGWVLVKPFIREIRKSINK
ncbi:MAG: Wzz/FepE/Etk N-terminal domain-containing protein [Bacteroidia bacterium]|nr:Wzz/FepE/Etk N-terminal domain-containing protein [Bacteroidia bacterium]